MFDHVDVMFASNPDAGTSVHLVATDQIEQIEDAVELLMPHHILGIDWKAGPGVGEFYQPIRVVTISAGEHTIVLDIVEPGKLPTAIRLLLTHQDYTKVVYGAKDLETVLGRFYKDFGFMPRDTYNVEDCIMKKYGNNLNLFEAFKRKFRHTKLTENFYEKALSPKLEDLEEIKKVRLFSFIAWATRDIFLSIGKPQGEGANLKCTASKIKVRDLKHKLTCPHCGDIHESEAALRAHITATHVKHCPCCDFQTTSDRLLQTHLEQNHIRCDDCGEWVKDAIALGRHHKRYHSYICPVRRCGLKCASGRELEEHMHNHHNQCQLCLKWFLDLNELELHEETVHPKCSYCNAQFYSLNALQKHRYARVNGVCVKVGDDGIDLNRRPTTAPTHPRDDDFLHDSPKYSQLRRSMPIQSARPKTSSRLSHTYGGRGFTEHCLEAPRSTSNSKSKQAQYSSEVILPNSGIDNDKYSFEQDSMDDPTTSQRYRNIPGRSTHHQDNPGTVRWVEPPRTEAGPLHLSRIAQEVGEIPE